ncbi:MAG: molybdopterin molybdotransferase MoeA [Candidatus Thermoplasmatota archaeon]|nr:molybdopterin molybdotransferase MoeA [Candidatus Thermoplasmatota archaeon]
MHGFDSLMPFSTALENMNGRKWNQTAKEIADVRKSAGRISAADVYAGENSPSFNRSAVDGYAVISSDVSGASEYNFITLTVKGEIEAGKPNPESLDHMQAFEIYTGGELPDGSDAVVMAEYAERTGNFLKVFRSVRKYENVSRAGEDISNGQKIVEAGEIIRPQQIAACIAVGIESLAVFSVLGMGIVSTGNEIMPGMRVRNTTQPLLLSYFSSPYMKTHDLGVVPDDSSEIEASIRKGIDLYDILVVTGGTSIGTWDLVTDVLDRLGEMVFGGVMIRPGRTISLYDVRNKPVFSVSGLPVAALISLEAFLGPYLSAQTGLKRSRVVVKAAMTERVANRDGMRSYLRVKVRNTENGLYADPLRISGSGILSSLLLSNGITVIPEDREGLEQGEIVDITLIGDVY